MSRGKFFKCPHCEKEYIFRNPGEPEQHIKECPYQFKDPQKRFEARQALLQKKR